MGYVTVPDSELLAWRQAALQSLDKAEAASAEYNQKKPGVKKHIRDNPAIYGGEDFNRRRALKESWILNDIQDVYNWHRRNANMYHEAIQAELALRNMPEGP